MSKICQNTLWIAAVAERGIIAHVKVCADRTSAVNDLAAYLKENHGYTGRSTMESVFRWLRRHDEYLGAEILCQDGLTLASAKDNIGSFISDGGFIVVGKNTQDPNPHLPIEAWAYKGPLNFESAAAITFGLGSDYSEAIAAIDMHIADHFDKKTTSSQ